jgi:metallo-beta-lactamase class B
LSHYVPSVLCLVRVVAGLLFLQHGLEKLFGFAGARPEETLWGIRGVGGILEAVGGPLLALGLLTRPVAFILSGEMAVAYFRSWAPRGFFPIANGGEEATLNAFIFLWLVAAGAGAWSLDAVIERRRAAGGIVRRVASWEPQLRAMLRLILGFLITLHGIRKVFDVLASVAGRRGAAPLALDSLPAATGYLELVAGPLLMLGLFVRQTALVVSIEALLAYVLIAQPRALWPIRNGGIEVLLYCVVFLYFAVAGAGAWSLDARRTRRQKVPSMTRIRASTSSFLILWLAVAVAPAAGQPPQGPAAPPKPDTPVVTPHVDVARKAAGTEWAAAVDFICKVNPDRANRADDPLIAPTRLFDNVYAIGRTGTVVYAMTTSAGIVLIDAGYADQLETVLLPGLKALGLDPSNVRYVLLGHGHGDHFGGAAYFQDRGARVVPSAADWDLMEAPAPPARGGGPPAAGPRPPKRDLVAVEGQGIVVGDVTFTPVSIPGHTPGSLGYVFPIKDGSRTHMAGLFGGSILIPGRIPDEGLLQYIRSVEHFGDVARTMNVEVELQNHPLSDGLEAKLERLKTRQASQPHPFVVGQASYQRFLTVMTACTRAQIERRKL